MEIKKIIIDPRFKINYASYYLFGLKQIFGAHKLQFKIIDDIDITTDRECRIGFAIKAITSDSEKRIYIDYGDWNEVYKKYYEWANVYAKINVRREDIELDKILVIGPSFGIKLWNPIKCLSVGLNNYLKIKRVRDLIFNRSIKDYMKDYGYMFMRRKRFKYYHRYTQEEQSDYCFSFNTLWYGDLSHNTTNKLRGEFMRECKRHMKLFEGGFYYVDHPVVFEEFPLYKSYLQQYGDLISKSRISMDDYDKRTRKSRFVFNTPSVGGCHGWKLAEYLCEGKAIISTHLINEMPAPFEAGVHYLHADIPSEMAEAIIRLRDDEGLVSKLKQNSFKYFNDFLSPEIVMKRVFGKLDPIE